MAAEDRIYHLEDTVPLFGNETRRGKDLRKPYWVLSSWFQLELPCSELVPFEATTIVPIKPKRNALIEIILRSNGVWSNFLREEDQRVQILLGQSDRCVATCLLENRNQKEALHRAITDYNERYRRMWVKFDEEKF